jgi:hypothetical protein
VNHCKRCNLPQIDGVAGYIGPVCKCGYLPYRYWPHPPEHQERPSLKPHNFGLTEDAVRRIVREEIARATGGGK